MDSGVTFSMFFLLGIPIQIMAVPAVSSEIKHCVLSFDLGREFENADLPRSGQAAK